MNWLIIVSGIFALFTTIGHFTIGSKKFLKPMLEAAFNPVAKKVMHCVFHYVSAFLILSSLALIYIGTGTIELQGSRIVVQFIAANYFAFAIWQIVIAITSDLRTGLFKLFQWVFFLLVALFAFFGTGLQL